MKQSAFNYLLPRNPERAPLGGLAAMAGLELDRSSSFMTYDFIIMLCGMYFIQYPVAKNSDKNESDYIYPHSNSNNYHATLMNKFLK